MEVCYLVAKENNCCLIWHCVASELKFNVHDRIHFTSIFIILHSVRIKSGHERVRTHWIWKLQNLGSTSGCCKFKLKLWTNSTKQLSVCKANSVITKPSSMVQFLKTSQCYIITRQAMWSSMEQNKVLSFRWGENLKIWHTPPFIPTMRSSITSIIPARLCLYTKQAVI